VYFAHLSLLVAVSFWPNIFYLINRFFTVFLTTYPPEKLGVDLGRVR